MKNLITYLLMSLVLYADKRVIINGQSNAAGSPGVAGDFRTSTRAAVNPRVFIWDTATDLTTPEIASTEGALGFSPQGSWEVWDMNGADQYGWNTRRAGGSPNMLWYWADSYQRRTGEDVYCIVVGHGNQGVEHFTSTGAENSGWIDLKGQLSEVGWEEGAVDFVVWSQGEWDDSRWSAQGRQYLNRFLQWRTELSQMQGPTDDTPVFVVQPTDVASDNITDQVFNVLPLRTDYDFYVLPTRALNGNVHFTAPSYEKIGREMINKLHVRVSGESINTTSEPIRVTLNNTNRLMDDSYNVTVEYEGAILESSNDLETWNVVSGASSPYVESVPREERYKHYRSTN